MPLSILKPVLLFGCLLSLSTVLAQAAGPVIFKALDPVQPDETALFFGDGVTPAATAEGLRLEDDPVNQPPNHVVRNPEAPCGALKVLQATDLSAKVLIPADWKPGIYAIRLKNAQGESEWQFLNRPKLWWMMGGPGGTAEPGGELRIFGLNFGKQSRVWLQLENEFSSVPVDSATAYDIVVHVPKEAVPGHYRVWVHNGFGGKAGFGESMEIEIAKRIAWPEKRFDVRQFGATGDGHTDDTQALRAALAAAKTAGGGVVWLPRGNYIVTGKLVVPERTTVRGEDRDWVWLRVPSKAAPFESVLAGNGNFSVEDLSIVAQTPKRLIASPDEAGTYTHERANWGTENGSVGRVALRKLRLQHLMFAHHVQAVGKGFTTVALRGPDCEISDCVIVSSGMPLQMSIALRAKIVRNQFGTGKGGWYGIWDFQQGVFEGNEITARDLGGSYGGVQRTARCLLFRDNYWHDAYGWDREALSFDSPYYPIWIGQVQTSGAATLEFVKKEDGAWPPAPGQPSALAAVIVAGKGLGQFLPIRAINPNGVVLETAWKIPPDDKSTVVIAVNKSNVLVVNNRFADASVAAQLYAQSYSFVVAGNHSERTGGSYANGWDAVNPKRGRRFSYAYFNQWLGNEFLHGFVWDQGLSSEGLLGYSVSRSAEAVTVPAIGNRYERNTIDAATVLEARSAPKPRSGDALIARDAIFENNLGGDSPVRISIGKGNAFTLIRKNGESAPALEDNGIQTKVVISGTQSCN